MTDLCNVITHNITFNHLYFQLAAVIKSLDDLTERYEVENTILEEKVLETMNEVRETKIKVTIATIVTIATMVTIIVALVTIVTIATIVTMVTLVAIITMVTIVT